MHQPLISIIIPIYKVEPYLRRCLDSIINQTYKNLEIILVDDGSPDNCPQICEEYAAKDNRIIAIHKENGGLSDARNAGLDICKGEYISFVDSDDWVVLNYIEILSSICLKENADITIGNHKKVAGNNEFKFCNNLNEYKTLNSYQALENLFGEHALNFTVSWGKLYKAKLWTELRFPKDKLYEDAYLCHLLYSNSSTICFLDEPIYFYTQRSDSIMGLTKSSFHAIEPQILFYTFLKNNNLKNLSEKMLPTISWTALQAYCGTHNPKYLLYARDFFNDIPHKKNPKTNFALSIFLHFPQIYTLFRRIKTIFS
jgi:glycosyltransferase involved in cell wall biosynthesis